MNGEQKGAACGHLGGDNRGYHHSAHTDQVRETEAQGARVVHTSSNHCLHSPSASRESSLTFLIGTSQCSQNSGLCPTKEGWYLFS